MSWFLLLILVAVILGIIGFTVEGLFYLFIIGIVVFLVDLVLFGLLLGRRRGSRPHR
jgi:hypothetical protein